MFHNLISTPEAICFSFCSYSQNKNNIYIIDTRSAENITTINSESTKNEAEGSEENEEEEIGFDTVISFLLYETAGYFVTAYGSRFSDQCLLAVYDTLKWEVCTMTMTAYLNTLMLSQVGSSFYFVFFVWPITFFIARLSKRILEKNSELIRGSQTACQIALTLVSV